MLIVSGVNWKIIRITKRPEGRYGPWRQQCSTLIGRDLSQRYPYCVMQQEAVGRCWALPATVLWGSPASRQIQISPLYSSWSQAFYDSNRNQMKIGEWGTPKNKLIGTVPEIAQSVHSHRGLRVLRQSTTLQVLGLRDRSSGTGICACMI